MTGSRQRTSCGTSSLDNLDCTMCSHQRSTPVRLRCPSKIIHYAKRTFTVACAESSVTKLRIRQTLLDGNHGPPRDSEVALSCWFKNFELSTSDAHIWSYSVITVQLRYALSRQRAAGLLTRSGRTLVPQARVEEERTATEGRPTYSRRPDEAR
jgi:hypothetical protein